jgi:hypothetical protein
MRSSNRGGWALDEPGKTEIGVVPSSTNCYHNEHSTCLAVAGHENKLDNIARVMETKKEERA